MKPRGFFARSNPTANMKKLIPRRGHFHHQQHQQERYLCFKRYYKWLLWLSLSLYLFISTSSHFLQSKPHLSQTTLPSTTAATQSLIDSAAIAAASDPAIYIYDLPPRYNRDWLSNPRCATHLFASEVAIHTALLASPYRTADPAAADFFFVPVYVSCNFSTVNGFPALSHASPLIASAVDHLSAAMPFWNRSAGRDHVFVASHDHGACFHAMEETAAAAGIPPFLRGSVILQTFGVLQPHPCQAAEHVLIPPFVAPEPLAAAVAATPPERDIFVFFRGKMEVHPKNISGRFYSRKVRTEIWRRFGENRRFYLRRHRFDGYRSEIARSVFCLCPRGWAPWSPRLVEAVALGCVPVIVADGILLPFPEAVPWPEISVRVPEAEVDRLEEVLDRVAATNLTAMQRRLADPAVRQALLFHSDGVQEGDATWQVVRALGGKLDRSWRRRGQSESR